MTDKLPPNLLALFAPRPPLRYLPAVDAPPNKRKTPFITGVAEWLPALQDYKQNDVYNPTESHDQRKLRLRKEKEDRANWLATDGVKLFNPREDPNAVGDPLKTLFIARLSYDATEKDLEAEFGRFGPIERIRIVTNISESSETKEKIKQEEMEVENKQEESKELAQTNNTLTKSGGNKKKKTHQGYAFIVYERPQDMLAAYKMSDGTRIRGRPVLVDVERGRTVANWRPRRLGGGLGGRGYTKGGQPQMNGVRGNFGGPPAGPGGFRGGGGGFQGRPGGFGGGDFRGGRGGSFRGRPDGGFRGAGGGGAGGGGGRGGIGYQSNGFGSGTPPDGAPAGPRGGGGRFSGGYGGRSYDDRGPPRNAGASGSNSEPVGPRRGGYRDLDRDGGYGGDRGGRGDDRSRGGDDSRKRRHDGDGYDDRRNRPRY